MEKNVKVHTLLAALVVASLCLKDSNATPPAAPASPSISGLAGYWPLDEATGAAAADASGNGGAGIHRNGPSVSPLLPVMPNYACNIKSLEFVQAADQSVEVPASSPLAFTGSFTLAAWVRPTLAANGTQRAIISKRDDGTGYPNGYELKLDSSLKLTALVHDGTGPIGVSSGTAVPVGSWTHVAATYAASSGVLTLYRNGVSDGFAVSVPPPAAGTSSFWIGNGPGTDPFEGNIDEVRAYSRALLPAEVAILMNGQLPATGLSTTPLPGQIRLDWSAATDATSYTVKRGAAALGPFADVMTGLTGTTFTDSAVSFGSTYFYTVTAFSVAESCPTAAVSGSPLAVPPKTTSSGDSRNLAHRCGCESIATPPGLTALWGAALLALSWMILRR